MRIRIDSTLQDILSKQTTESALLLFELEMGHGFQEGNNNMYGKNKQYCLHIRATTSIFGFQGQFLVT